MICVIMAWYAAAATTTAAAAAAAAATASAAGYRYDECDGAAAAVNAASWGCLTRSLTHMHTSTQARMYTHAHTRTHVHTRTRTRTHTHAQLEEVVKFIKAAPKVAGAAGGDSDLPPLLVGDFNAGPDTDEARILYIYIYIMHL